MFLMLKYQAGSTIRKSLPDQSHEIIFNRKVRIRFVLMVLICLVPITLFAGGRSGYHRLPYSVQSSSIRDRWEEMVKRLDPRTKSYPDNKNHALLDLLEESGSAQVMIELEKVRSSQTDYRDMSDYDQTVVQALTLKFVHQKNQRQIVYLLSGKFPRYIGTVPTELFLGINAKDNVLLLIESYRRATNEAVRKRIMEALSHVFREIRQKYQSDQAFIDGSKKWYLRNRNNIKVNAYYDPRDYGPITGDFFIRKRQGTRG